ncbi:hypothetical protein MTYP_00646 [Methylophilaceae bacterium]|nr:hypothetical protein MTYP_00646 [Methylophilaceae bacterium]
MTPNVEIQRTVKKLRFLTVRWNDLLGRLITKCIAPILVSSFGNPAIRFRRSQFLQAHQKLIGLMA